MKALAWFIVIAVIGLIGWRLYPKFMAGDKGPVDRKEAPVPVEVAAIGKGTVRDTGIFTGSLDPRSQFVVSPKAGGKLKKLNVNIGDAVKSGAEIALLDDDEYVQAAEQAKAELAVAAANVEHAQSQKTAAEREFRRLETLRAKSIASETELDRARVEFEAREAGYKVAQSQVLQREAARKTAAIRLAYTRITADWPPTVSAAGGSPGEEVWFVGERFVEEGALVRANDPIVSVVDINTLIGVINVTDRDYSRVRVGQPVRVTADAFPGRSFTGTVVRIAPLFREESRQARVELELPNAGHELRPGMFIRAEIEFSRRADVTVIPVNAVANRDGTTGIFMVDQAGARVTFTPLTAGLTDQGLVEVVAPAGLTGRVVTTGHHLLRDGAAITVVQPAGMAPAAAPVPVPATGN
ncbi:MAG: efflux RND transporter periplasmic adaptor subunit [Planctomycetota bacterium]